MMIIILTSNNNLSKVQVRAACHKAPAVASGPPGPGPRRGDPPGGSSVGLRLPDSVRLHGPGAACQWSRGPGGPQLEKRQLGVPWCLISKQAPSPGRGPPRASGLRHLCPSGTKNADSPLTGTRQACFRPVESLLRAFSSLSPKGRLRAAEAIHASGLLRFLLLLRFGGASSRPSSFRFLWRLERCCGPRLTSSASCARASSAGCSSSQHRRT